MKARPATIVSYPNPAFIKRIDPLTGRVFTDTIGNIVASGLSAIVEKVCAVVIFRSKEEVDAGVSSGNPAQHAVHFFSPDTLTAENIQGALASLGMPNSATILTPTTVTSQRSKVWGMDGFPATVTAPNGEPTEALKLALFGGLVMPSKSTSTVSQVIQMVGDAIESSRSLPAPELAESVMVVVSQNAGAIVIANNNTFIPDPLGFGIAAGITHVADLNVAASDIPAATTSGNFGE